MPEPLVERLVTKGFFVKGHPCPECLDEEPERALVKIAGRTAKVRIYSCCFAVCHGKVVARFDLCNDCSECDSCCTCSTCSYSGHKTSDSVCDDCDSCQDHCECLHCSDCGGVSDLCDNCSEGTDCCCACTVCEDCENRTSESHTVEGNREVCSRCIDNYSYCEHCEEYCSDNDDHSHSCDCEAPHMRFQFPAKGIQSLNTVAQDERIKVQLPKGTIDREGLNRIITLIREPIRNSYPLVFQVAIAVEEVGPEWQGKRGNFTKRLSSALHKRGIKVEPATIAQVGNLARQHSSEGAEWLIEFTRDLNQEAGYFYHSGSCWWGSYGDSRCCLKNWGGIAMRSFDKGRPTYAPSGRAWIQPLDEDMKPTHFALDAHAFVVYNGYGALEGYIPARIVAQLTGLTYKKISFGADEMYVNDDTGYLVADEDTCAEEDNHSIRFSNDPHHKFDVNKRVDLVGSLI